MDWKCIRCNKDIGPECNGCLLFDASGNYGSNIFDPVCNINGAPKLLIRACICDECVKANMVLMMGLKIEEDPIITKMGVEELLVCNNWVSKNG